MHCVNQKQIKQTEGQNGIKVENKEIPASRWTPHIDDTRQTCLSADLSCFKNRSSIRVGVNMKPLEKLMYCSRTLRAHSRRIYFGRHTTPDGWTLMHQMFKGELKANGRDWDRRGVKMKLTKRVLKWERLTVSTKRWSKPANRTKGARRGVKKDGLDWLTGQAEMGPGWQEFSDKLASVTVWVGTRLSGKVLADLVDNGRSSKLLRNTRV